MANKEFDGTKTETPQTLEILIGEYFHIKEMIEADPHLTYTKTYMFAGRDKDTIIFHLIDKEREFPVYYPSTLEHFQIAVRIPDFKGTLRFYDPSDTHKNEVMKLKYDSILITYFPPKKEQMKE